MNQNQIVNHLKTLVSEERKITSEILKLLQQVESQKIFAKHGYSNLFEFCMKELGYSEGAAQRRISAMRLIKELPEVEEKIVSGSISLSVASQAQSFFRKKKSLNKTLGREQKIEVLKQLENSSSRQSEKLLLDLEPELLSKDRERLITPEHLEIKITVEREFIENIEKLKDLLSHQMPFASTKDILAYALKELVKRKDPRERVSVKASCNIVPPTSAAHVSATNKSTPEMPAINKRNRYIPKDVKQYVWQKSNGTCSYVNSQTGQKCTATRFLEIDHIHPKSRDGGNNPENLQLLCDTHNRLKSDRILS